LVSLLGSAIVPETNGHEVKDISKLRQKGFNSFFFITFTVSPTAKYIFAEDLFADLYFKPWKIQSDCHEHKEDMDPIVVDKIQNIEIYKQSLDLKIQFEILGQSLNKLEADNVTVADAFDNWLNEQEEGLSPI
jgi:hypothetical protein